MTITHEKYTVSYYQNRVVLKGERHAIQAEANRILGLFLYSAQPYHIQSTTADCIVIAPSSGSN